MEAGTVSGGVGALGLLGIGASLTAVFAMWGTVKGWLSTAVNMVIWQDNLTAEASRALSWWMTSEKKEGRRLTSKTVLFGISMRNYGTNSWMTGVLEYPLVGGRFIKIGAWPAWIDRNVDKEIHNLNCATSNAIRILSLRGTLDMDKFISGVCREYDEYKKQGEKGISKFKFVRMSGSRGGLTAGMIKKESQESKGAEGAPPAPPDTFESYTWVASNRRVNFTMQEFVPGISESKDVEFCQQQSDMMSDMSWWLSNERWYADRGISWRRGYLLHGRPGTGKTRMVRMAAQRLNVPVYSLDLSTFNNNELTEAWMRICSAAPAVVLVEDFDAVFCGRENLTDTDTSKGVTFDCFLSCLDGIEGNNGISVVMTTNKIECLDEALAACGKPSRPGRIDKCIEMQCLDLPAVRVIAEKIVRHPELVEDIVAKGAADDEQGRPWTIAQCIAHCTEQAMALASVEAQSTAKGE